MGLSVLYGMVLIYLPRSDLHVILFALLSVVILSDLLSTDIFSDLPSSYTISDPLSSDIFFLILVLNLMYVFDLLSSLVVKYPVRLDYF
jgi:hypothetical protein